MKSQRKRAKKGIVEETSRINVHEAVHIGARIVAVPIAGSHAAKRYALCPLCSCRVLYSFMGLMPRRLRRYFRGASLC